MAKVVVIPKLGLTMTEGTISKWFKHEGDNINEGEALFEISTDKLTNEISSEVSGVVRKIIVKENETAPVTAPIAIIADEKENIEDILKELNINNKVEETKTVNDSKVFSERKVEEKKGNIVVIGGGPGGYVAAIRAAQLGGEVTLIENEKLGGTCLNVGCIPTKALIHSAEILNDIKESKDMGIDIEGGVKINWNKIQERKNSIVNKLTSGVGGLLSINKVKVINGYASFLDDKTLKIVKGDGCEEKVTFENAIIASGSVPAMPPFKGIDLEGVIDSTGALSLPKIPESLVIIGGGVIGVEFANLYNTFGCKVTIIEMLPFFLPPIDGEIRDMLKKKLTKNGVEIHNGAKVSEISKDPSGLKVSFEENGDVKFASAEKVLVAVGRRPNTKGLNLEAAGINVERGFIKVSDTMETNVKGIYAIGDCTGKNMLAHVASEQGIVAAECIMGKDSKMDYKTIPACVYTKPELASVGLTEEQVKEKGIEYKVGKFPLSANGKALIMNDTEGIVKIIADKKYGEILGVHILGPRATDLIVEPALALRLEATVDEIVTTIHAHPTVGEALKEASLAVNKEAIHTVNR